MIRPGLEVAGGLADRTEEGGDLAQLLVVEGTEGDGRNFMVVAGQTFPDLDQTLTGMKTDDIKSVELQFPEGFQEADWAGKKHKATVTVRSVSSIELPEVDDQFDVRISVVHGATSLEGGQLWTTRLRLGPPSSFESIQARVVAEARGPIIVMWLPTK